jgi:hypothetical protein
LEDPTTAKPSEQSLLLGTGPLAPQEARLALEQLRASVIEAEIGIVERHRCILRDALIEHFIGIRFSDPSEWLERVPRHLREGTDPSQKRFLEDICKVMDRMQ